MEFITVAYAARLRRDPCGLNGSSTNMGPVVDSLLQSLGFGAMHPALLAGGAMLMASPILIHLLSKRRFRKLDWAAMDFLMEADRRNRRRVRLEDLLLMLLRCLAILLIALLVARVYQISSGLFLPTSSSPVEHIILLDDSPSMRVDNAMDDAKKRLVSFVEELADTRDNDKITLQLTSQPETLLIHSKECSPDHVQQIIEEIKEIQPSDLKADLPKSFLAIAQYLEQKDSELNHIVHVFTDMRELDWGADPGSENADVVELIQDMTKSVGLVDIVDVGNDKTVSNLSVTEVKPVGESSLVVGVDAVFQVKVRNEGPGEATKVPVRFSFGDAVSLKETIDRIEAGEERKVTFSVTTLESGPVKVVARIEGDALPTDNERFYAAQVLEGIHVLVVDGDPSDDKIHSEVYYLTQALQPKGDPFGFLVDYVTETLFETKDAKDLDQYDLIILANLYRLAGDPNKSLKQAKVLEQWVRNGGGLIFYLGDQVDEKMYNQQLYRDGKGLLPVKLETIGGQRAREEWVYFKMELPNHPVTKASSGNVSALTQNVKVFQWWVVSVPNDKDNVKIIASYTDVDSTPAIVQKSLGRGRVIAITTSADVGWNDWARRPNYPPFLHELSHYMRRRTLLERTRGVGIELRYDLDPAVHEVYAKVLTPTKEKVAIQAGEKSTNQTEKTDRDPKGRKTTENDSTEPPEGADKLFDLEFQETMRQGFYQMQVKRLDRTSDTILFARNIDPAEGNLMRATSLDDLKKNEKIRWIHQPKENLSLELSGSKNPLWENILYVLLAVLFAELVLGWVFGRRR